MNKSKNYNANEVLKSLVQLVMCTDYFKEETKRKLQGSTYSMSGLDNVNKNTIKSRIQYDISKFKRELGAHMHLGILSQTIRWI